MSSINKNTIPMQTRTIQDLVGREMVKIHDRKCKTSFAEERAHLQAYLDDLKRSESDLLKTSKILSVVTTWRDKQKVTCKESIYQCDWVQESLYELASALLEIVGPYEGDV